MLKSLRPPGDENLIVGFETSDDAAVYRISADQAVISTVDFITPPVDDPWWYGQIAAANALSDVYAMGGRPLTALNVVMFPSRVLDTSVLKEILRGGHEKVEEAGAVVAGGHSVEDEEPKYGLAVTGLVRPERVLTNGGSKAGDALVLTKPIGTGVLFNACRSGSLPLGELEPLLPEIASLNKTALHVALEFGVNACTDVTGFGLAGHLLEMAKGSGKSMELFYGNIPFYPNAPEMYRKGETTRNTRENRSLATGRLKMEKSLTPEEENLLFDPQTSGGLVFSLPEREAGELVARLKERGVLSAALVGRVTAGGGPEITIR